MPETHWLRRGESRCTSTPARCDRGLSLELSRRSPELASLDWSREEVEDRVGERPVAASRAGAAAARCGMGEEGEKRRKREATGLLRPLWAAWAVGGSYMGLGPTDLI